MTEHILTATHGRIGVLTLNRAQALNSLSLEMVRAITRALLDWRNDSAIDAVLIHSSSEKAFCAGGDIRFFYQAAQQTPQQGGALLDDFFTEEYLLNRLIQHYPKPYIAFMDGIVMGGGMGISQSHAAGRLRIVTERSKLAMPEVNIGLFPDVGGGYFLSRCPGQIGAWMALTANAIGAADAIHAGLADVFIPSARLPELKASLLNSTNSDVATQVRAFAAQFGDCGTAGLVLQRERIDRHFGFDEVQAIMDSLAGDPAPFAQATLAAMQKRSPLMQCVTLKQLRLAARLPLEDCLRMERSMMRHCFARGEAREGIRAAVIDKDMQPAWTPAMLAQVSAQMVDDFFQPAWPEQAHPLRCWL